MSLLDWSLIANLASVVGTVGGLLFIWWQVRQIREVNAYGLVNDQVKRWNSPEMRACRARLANTLLVSQPDLDKITEDGDEVLGFFEFIGLLLRRRLAPVYYIWTMQSYEILLYWQVLRGYLVWFRRSTNDHTYYIEFDLLRERVAAFQKKMSGLEPVYTEEEVREFLEAEAKRADGAATVRKHRRMIPFTCPNCNVGLSVPAEKIGQEKRCPKCGAIFAWKRV